MCAAVMSITTELDWRGCTDKLALGERAAGSHWTVRWVCACPRQPRHWWRESLSLTGTECNLNFGAGKLFVNSILGFQGNG
jgi:hypothetical protein